METLKAQLLPEFDNLAAQHKDLQQRDTDRMAAFDTINSQMAPALTQLVAACATLSAEENRALCQLLPAPGPRTVDMVNQINMELAGKVAQP